MSETERHILKLFVIETLQERSHLEANASKEFVCLLSSLALDTQLFSDDLSELLISKHESLFDTLLDDIFLKELLERLREITLKKLLHRLHGVLCILEFLECLQLHYLRSTFGGLEVLGELICILKLFLVLKNFEQCKTCWGLK